MPNDDTGPAASHPQAEGAPCAMRWVRTTRHPVAMSSAPDAMSRPHAPPETLVGILAHELRTPITTVYAGSALLARDVNLLPTMRRELAADICAEAGRVYRVVEDLLVLTQLERGAIRPAREPLRLDRAIGAAVKVERDRWPMLRVRATVEGPVRPAAADSLALGHILRNLIANVGWRATSPADLDIEVGMRRDRVACRFLDRTGSLPAVTLDTLYDLPATEAAGAAQSPGIALYVARELLLCMGGTVWARPLDDATVELGFDLPAYESVFGRVRASAPSRRRPSRATTAASSSAETAGGAPISRVVGSGTSSGSAGNDPSR
jgi:two-component system OmpR family sensor kinase